MSTAQEQNAIKIEPNGTHARDHQTHQRRDYGGNPLAHINTGDSARLPAFGGDFQPGLYKVDSSRKFANPAPLGLAAFALTTFLLSLINLGTRGIPIPNIVIGPAFAYGGLVQLLAGMWEMAVGNTFGATALSSYGGFWIGTAIILTPGGFAIETDLEAESTAAFYNSFGLYLMGWFIFTFVLLICTLKSTLAFFLLFLFLDLAFLFLSIAYLQPQGADPNTGLLECGGAFGILSAFMAWYNALAGIADPSNSFFIIPVLHFPWSDKGREQRRKQNEGETSEQVYTQQA